MRQGVATVQQNSKRNGSRDEPSELSEFGVAEVAMVSAPVQYHCGMKV